MADASTTRYLLTKPEVGASADTWGTKLNTDWDSVDKLLGAITTAGSGAAYTLTSGQSLSAYTAGQGFWIKASFTCSGAATLNVDSLGAKNITKNGTTATVSGDIVSGTIYYVSYDGTQFQIVGPISGGLQPLDATLTALAALAWSSGHPVIQFTAADTVSLTTTITAGVGAAATPSYTFEGDTNTGLFWVSADILGITTGGVSTVTFGSYGMVVNLGSCFVPNGTVSAPSVAFVNDQDCGLYLIGANNIGLATGGALAVDWNTTRALFALDVQRPTNTSSPVAASVGYIGTIIVAKDTNYTIAQNIAGQTLYHTSASTHTYTIDSNANLALPVGFMFKIVNENGGGNITLAITTDTLRWGALTGSRTIPANSTAVLTKVASTLWRMEAGGNVS